MKITCVGVLSVIELKNARWNIENEYGVFDALVIEWEKWHTQRQIWRSLDRASLMYFISIANKMQHYTIFFIIVNAVCASGGFTAHHQELKNCTHNIGYMSSLLAATASCSSKQAWHIPDAVYTVFELLMMGGETAWNT